MAQKAIDIVELFCISGCGRLCAEAYVAVTAAGIAVPVAEDVDTVRIGGSAVIHGIGKLSLDSRTGGHPGGAAPLVMNRREHIGGLLRMAAVAHAVAGPGEC